MHKDTKLYVHTGIDSCACVYIDNWLYVYVRRQRAMRVCAGAQSCMRTETASVCVYRDTNPCVRGDKELCVYRVREVLRVCRDRELCVCAQRNKAVCLICAYRNRTFFSDVGGRFVGIKRT